MSVDGEDHLVMYTTLIDEYPGGFTWQMSRLWWKLKCCCGKRRSTGNAPVPIRHIQSQIITLPGAIATLAARIQKTHDATMLSRRVCRTAPLTLDAVRSLLTTLPVNVVPTKELTAGGMSRIYATENPHILVKISDMSRGWSKYEHRNYKMLRRHKIPAAAILHACLRRGYMIIVVERLEFTVTSVLRSVTELNALYLDEVVRGLHAVLNNLRQAQITFADLSPENIVCRRVVPVRGLEDEPDMVRLELVLIDPQFAVSTSELAELMGPRQAEEFDTIHLALKIMAIGLEDGKRGRLRLATNAVSCAVLRTEELPPMHSMKDWLLNKVPISLQLAYKALDRMAEEKNGAGEYADSSETEHDNKEEAEQATAEKKERDRK